MLILRGTGPSYREVPDGTPERDIIQKLHNDIQGMYPLKHHREASATTISVIRYSVWKWLLTFIGANGNQVCTVQMRLPYYGYPWVP